MIESLGYLLSISISAFLARRGYRKQSLSLSGAIAAFIVGSITLSAGAEFGASMLFFYQTGSVFTKYKQDVKKRREIGFREGGQRDAGQVLSNSIFGTILAGAICALRSRHGLEILEAVASACFGILAVDTRSLRVVELCLAYGFVAHYACATGDTWASEIGILSDSRPILITQPWREVPPGTNGGVTMLGCGVSFLGGLAVGLLYAFVHLLKFQEFYPSFVLIGAFGGLVGSFLDSFLGATLQATYTLKGKDIVLNEDVIGKYQNEQKITGLNLLSNSQVNQLSLVITSLFAMALQYAELKRGR